MASPIINKSRCLSFGKKKNELGIDPTNKLDVTFEVTGDFLTFVYCYFVLLCRKY